MGTREKAVSRREFAIRGLGIMAGAAGLATIGLVGCGPSTGTDADGEGDYSSPGGSLLTDGASMSWNRETDVLVIGAGGAGAAAALIADENGCETLLLEKGTFMGGATALSGQAIATGGSNAQKEAGIDDTVEAFRDWLLEVSDGDVELLKTWAMDSLDAYNWLCDMGLEVPGVIGAPGITFGGSHKVRPFVPRTHWSTGLWQVLQQALDDKGLEVLLETPAIALITDVHTGEVVGALAGDASKPLAIQARKAVVLSAGGFMNNDDMVRKHITNGIYVSFASPTDDGDGIKLAQSVGADTSYLYSLNDCSAHNDPPGACTYLVESARPMIAGEPPFIAVNAEARRFVDESNFQVMVNRAIMTQTDGYCYVVTCGEDGINGFALQSGLDKAQLPTSLRQSDTIEGLAEQIGLNPAALAETVTEWNGMCSAGADTAFAREATLKPIGTPPYAAAQVYPGGPSTLSGVTVDTSMQVISALTGRPVPRLFAAGANSNAQGRVYPCCGAALTCCVSTGRIAGANASKLEAWT
jgi:fumarate reductase flavoprotein subunit